MKSLKSKPRYIHFYQFEIFAIKAAEKKEENLSYFSSYM